MKKKVTTGGGKGIETSSSENQEIKKLYSVDLLLKLFEGGRTIEIKEEYAKEIKEALDNKVYASKGGEDISDINKYNEEGKREGFWKEYYENGNLKEEGNYENGIMEGLWRFYDRNGKLKCEGNYKDGREEGLWRLYDKDGKLYLEETL